MTPTRSDRIHQLVAQRTAEFDPQQPRQSLSGLQTPALARETGISGNNASMELSRLHRAGKLVRVGGRPVAYLCLDTLEQRLGVALPDKQFAGEREFLDCLYQLLQEPVPPPSPPPRHAVGKGSGAANPSKLDQLLGADGSLARQIHQAKAAITYPPFGLHTLFTGSTGTGKSLFANCMFDYAVKSGAMSADASVITFDCAHYSENPQLVLSQLFGYCKGSFTGADKDQMGLVEHADGGILFLDEIHRLTPEGQEKMFLLMDNGVFRRLGETGGYRHARVLIIGATTEDPKNIMLNTFLRRIPVHITLPELEKRTVRERLQLILYFLWREARNIKTRISLEADTLSMLLHYSCPANVGQLASDIKLTCANAYYDYQIGRSLRVHILPSHLGERVRDGLFTVSGTGDSMLLPRMLREPDAPLELSGALNLGQVFARLLKD